MIFNHLEKLCDAFNIDRPIIVVELALRTREKAEESQKFHFGWKSYDFCAVSVV